MSARSPPLAITRSCNIERDLRYFQRLSAKGTVHFARTDAGTKASDLVHVWCWCTLSAGGGFSCLRRRVRKCTVLGIGAVRFIATLFRKTLARRSGLPHSVDRTDCRVGPSGSLA